MAEYTYLLHIVCIMYSQGRYIVIVVSSKLMDKEAGEVARIYAERRPAGFPWLATILLILALLALAAIIWYVWFGGRSMVRGVVPTSELEQKIPALHNMIEDAVLMISPGSTSLHEFTAPSA